MAPHLATRHSRQLVHISSNPDSTGEKGAFSGFGNTSAPLRAGIVGCEAVGGRQAVKAKYAGALAKGHTITPCIFEVFGGMDRDAVDLLNAWASHARGKTPPGEEPPWCARNFVPYWSQLLSKEAQRGAAEEIIGRVREEATAHEARRARSG